MADSKITALAALTAADPVNDMFPVVDVSDTSMAASGTTKRISANNILSSSPTASGALTVTGLVTAGSATITGDLTVDTNIAFPSLFVDSTNNRVGMGTASPGCRVDIVSDSNTSLAPTLRVNSNNVAVSTSLAYDALIGSSTLTIQSGTSAALVFNTNNVNERHRIASDGVATWSNVGGVAGTAMTLNSTGLGVGGVPVEKLTVAGKGFFVLANPDVTALKLEASTGTNAVAINFVNTGGNYFVGVDNSAGGRLYGVPYSLCVGSTGAYPVVIATNNTARLTVDSLGNLILLSPSTPPTLATNGQLTVNATSNTNLRFSYRGSDGTTRVANITLA